MSAALKLVPEVVDHSGGAEAALNYLTGYRAHDKLRPAFHFLPQPCEYCGRTKCEKQRLFKEWVALKAGNAPADMIALAEKAYMSALAGCHQVGPFGLLPARDIETDDRGYCALDNNDYRDDRAKERRR